MVDRVGPGVVLSKVTGSWPEAVLLLPARSLTRSAGIVTVTSTVGARRQGECVVLVVAEEWVRDEAVPPVTETSDPA